MNGNQNPRIVGAHGGYRKLQSFQTAEIIYDGTIVFCRKCLDSKSRTIDQMIQAARSGKQNIAEGSRAAGTSQSTEIKLTSVARSSLEELLLDYEDFLRQNNFSLWQKEHPKAEYIRNLAATENRSYDTYRVFIEEKSPETAANTIICLIHQANFLLDRQIRAEEAQFAADGGFSERLYEARSAAKRRPGS